MQEENGVICSARQGKTTGIQKSIPEEWGRITFTHHNARKALWDFPGGPAVKDPPANEGDTGLIPGWGGSPEESMTTHSSILAWRTP